MKNSKHQYRPFSSMSVKIKVDFKRNLLPILGKWEFSNVTSNNNSSYWTFSRFFSALFTILCNQSI